VKQQNPERNTLIVWDRIGDYHAARFRALEQQLGENHSFIADLGKADNLYGWANPLAQHPHYFHLSDKPVESFDFFRRIFRFLSILFYHKIKVVGIAGYGRPEYVFMLILSRLLGKRVVLFAESWYGTNVVTNKLKGIFLSLFCHGFLVSGRRAFEHFSQRLGLSPERILMGYSVVDNEHFESARDIEKENIILCVARFSPEKNLETLIKAFRDSKISQQYKLLIVGGGPLKQELTWAAGIANVEFRDWLSYQALPILYAHARLFVLPSVFEPWGLVVNEAMAAGLPVLVSQECGCALDLVDNTNGALFFPENPLDLTMLLDAMALRSASELSAMGKRSKEIISRYTPEVWATNFLTLASG
jgi:glycosyltransferase involved in cell wall biosynthesis